MALDVDAARAMVLRETVTLAAVELPLLSAVGRRLTDPVIARGTLPAADTSAMDGYAVRAEDLAAATAERPAVLRTVGHAWAGRPTGAAVGAGEAVQIATGALLPAGADTVVIQEATSLDPEDSERVRIRSAARRGANVRPAGEEYHPGEQLLPAGARLSAAGVGLLAGDGVTSVRVHRAPRIALLVTGTELQPAGAADLPAEARRDSNGPMLAAALGEAGADLPSWARATDDVAPVTDWLTATLRQTDPAIDLLLTSGGASVGERDVIGSAWESAGIETLFWGVAMKPGKPVRFGRFRRPDGTPGLAFALPGNPLAALTGFEQFVAPALAQMTGGWSPPPRLRLPLAAAQVAGRARVYFLRSALAEGDGRPAVEVPVRQGSGMLREAATSPLVAALHGPGDLPAGALVESIADPAALAGRCLRPVGPLPAVVGVRGRSDSGKTTLVEQLVPHLRRDGRRVGTVKHASHPPVLDQAGKDSHRHGQAGASPVLLLGPEQAALYFHQTGETELGGWLEEFTGRADLVVVEGFKQTPMPHIEIQLGDSTQLVHERQAGHRRWVLTRPAGAGGRFDEALVQRLADEVLAALNLSV